MGEKIKINLNDVEDIKSFVKIVMDFTEDIDVISGRFILDAKSIMALFSLDLSKNIEVMIHTKEESVYNKFLADIEKFRI